MEHFAQYFPKCAKKAVLAPFASLYATLPFCWAVLPECSTEPHFMFHNDYQPINKIRLRNEIPWNIMFHAPFSDVPRNVPRKHCAIKWSTLPARFMIHILYNVRARGSIRTQRPCVPTRMQGYMFVHVRRGGRAENPTAQSPGQGEADTLGQKWFIKRHTPYRGNSINTLG